MRRVLQRLSPAIYHHHQRRILTSTPLQLPCIFLPRIRSFCSSSEPPPPITTPAESSDAVPNESNDAVPNESGEAAPTEDVGNPEFMSLLKNYVDSKDKELLPKLMDAVYKRNLSKKHEQTDDEIVEDLRTKWMQPIENVTDKQFEEGLEEIPTDDEIDNLCDMGSIIEKKYEKKEYFNVDDAKWDRVVRDAMEKGIIKDISKCEEIIEDMFRWDNLLPDEAKQKVDAKFEELEDMCKNGEIEPEKAYQTYKEYADKMIEECELMMAKNQPVDELKIDDMEKKVRIDDPPGEGPVLRWQTRCVFTPGGAWHPKNRKVKLAVTVKELNLSKHALLRLKELVGKRYNPGKDELMITSERWEQREENRKDCLRTLYALIEEAMCGEKLASETRNAFVKSKLRTNAPFMEKLRSKVANLQPSLPA